MRQKALIVWGALCGGPLFLPMVALVVPPLLDGVDNLGYMRFVLVVPAFTLLLVAALWRGVLLPRALGAKKFAEGVAAEVAERDPVLRARVLVERSDARFFGLNVVGIALSEGGGLLAGVALLLLGVDSVPGAMAVGLSLLLLALHCPTAARFDDAAERVCKAAGVTGGGASAT